MSQVQRILLTEVRETAQLYLDGKIDQWYSLEDRPGVVFILNMTDTQAAHAMLEELPLGKPHLMTFQLTRSVRSIPSVSCWHHLLRTNCARLK
jgi:hypothetical protein